MRLKISKVLFLFVLPIAAISTSISCSKNKQKDEENNFIEMHIGTNEYGQLVSGRNPDIFVHVGSTLNDNVSRFKNLVEGKEDSQFSHWEIDGVEIGQDYVFKSHKNIIAVYKLLVSDYVYLTIQPDDDNISKIKPSVDPKTRILKGTNFGQIKQQFAETLEWRTDKYALDHWVIQYDDFSEWEIASDLTKISLECKIKPCFTKIETENIFNYEETSDQPKFITIKSIKPQTQPLDELVIPDKIDNLPVCCIGDNFSELSSHDLISNIKKVKLPDSLTQIGNNAFKDFTSIEEIIISSNIQTLGTSVFKGCTNLKNAHIYCECGNAESLFEDCTSLKSAIYYSKSNIAKATFKNCKSLRDFSIPNGCEIIGDYAFDGCEQLKTLNIPASIKKVGDFVFENSGVRRLDKDTELAYGLFKIYYEGTVYDWGNVEKTENITKWEDKGEEIESDDYDSIYVQCKYNQVCTLKTWPLNIDGQSHEDLFFVGNVDDINHTCTFSSIKGGVKPPMGTTFLVPEETTITNHSGVFKIIGVDREFEGSQGDGPKVKAICYPASCETFGSYPDLHGLDTYFHYIRVYNYPPFVKEFGCNANEMHNYDNDQIDDRENNGATRWVVLPIRLTEMGGFSLAQMTSLRTVIIPPTVTHVCEYTFAHSYNLTTITLPPSLTALRYDVWSDDSGGGVFYDCTGLENVYFEGNSLETIPRRTFAKTKISSITLPEGLKSVDNGAFFDVHNLNWIVIPSTVKQFKGVAFSCDNVSDKGGPGETPSLWYNGNGNDWELVKRDNNFINVPEGERPKLIYVYTEDYKGRESIDITRRKK